MSTLRNEKGAVLITSLLLLLVMTMLGLASMQNTSLEERMAGNVRAQNIAFQAAESALRGGENWMAGRAAAPVAVNNGSTQLWMLDAPDSDTTDGVPWWQEWQDAEWEGSNIPYYPNSLAVTDAVNLDAMPPRYVIEELGLVQDSLNVGISEDFVGRNFYQITARGSDVSERMRILLRSTYARRF